MAIRRLAVLCRFILLELWSYDSKSHHIKYCAHHTHHSTWRRHSASMHHAPSISLITPSASYPYTVTAHALAMRGEAEQAIVYMIEFTMACHVTFLRVIRGIYHDSASNSQHIKTVNEVECFGKTGAR